VPVTLQTTWACVAGELRVLSAPGVDGSPSALQLTLFTTNGARYKLDLKSGSRQWRTGMHVKVTAQQRAAAALPAGSVMPLLDVQRVDEVAPRVAASSSSSSDGTAATFVGPVDGSAPVSMAVLFILISMCGQPAPMTPAVRRDVCLSDGCEL
jgi:hypothetical protein